MLEFFFGSTAAGRLTDDTIESGSHPWKKAYTTWLLPDTCLACLASSCAGIPHCMCRRFFCTILCFKAAAFRLQGCAPQAGWRDAPEHGPLRGAISSQGEDSAGHVFCLVTCASVRVNHQSLQASVASRYQHARIVCTCLVFMSANG